MCICACCIVVGTSVYKQQNDCLHVKFCYVVWQPGCARARYWISKKMKQCNYPQISVSVLYGR